MATRYSRILSAARYYSAIDNYIQYITTASRRTTGRIGQGEPRPVSQRVYVDPFGVALPTGTSRIPVTLAQPSWTRYSTIAAVNTRASATAPTDPDEVVRWANFRAARIVIATGLTAQAVAKTSRVTGLQYGSYGGQSTSVPFGRANATDTEGDAFIALRAAITPTLTGNFRFSRVRERV